MTSNVANEEIASHALKLRREAEVAKQHRGAKGIEVKDISLLKYFPKQIFLRKL